MIAKAFVCAITSGGSSTISVIFPFASGQNVCEGIGLAPGALGISHNCRTLLPLGIGIFWPVM